MGIFPCPQLSQPGPREKRVSQFEQGSRRTWKKLNARPAGCQKASGPSQAALFFSPSMPHCPIMADSSLVVGCPAAVTITMRPRDGLERQFSSWHAEISTAAAGLAGFISAEVSTIADSQGRLRWRIIERFRDLDSMRAWRRSEPFQRLIE